MQGSMESYLKSQAAAEKEGKLPQYGAVTNNCSEFVCNSLRAGGLDLSTLHGFIAPGGVEAQLGADDLAGTETADQFSIENGQMNPASAFFPSQEIQNDAARQCGLGNRAAC